MHLHMCLVHIKSAFFIAWFLYVNEIKNLEKKLNRMHVYSIYILD
jgi:hypothetical protein